MRLPLLMLLFSSRHLTTVGGERTKVSSMLIAIMSPVADVAVDNDDVLLITSAALLLETGNPIMGDIAGGGGDSGDPSPLSDNKGSACMGDDNVGLPLRVRIRSPASWYILVTGNLFNYRFRYEK